MDNNFISIKPEKHTPQFRTDLLKIRDTYR